MAKLDLNPGETMIGSGQMSLYQKQGLTKKPFQGSVFVTNQRACFKISMMPGLEMDLPVEEIKGFSVGRIALFTAGTGRSILSPDSRPRNSRTGCGRQAYRRFDKRGWRT